MWGAIEIEARLCSTFDKITSNVLEDLMEEDNKGTVRSGMEEALCTICLIRAMRYIHQEEEEINQKQKRKQKKKNKKEEKEEKENAGLTLNSIKEQDKNAALTLSSMELSIQVKMKLQRIYNQQSTYSNTLTDSKNNSNENKSENKTENKSVNIQCADLLLHWFDQRIEANQGNEVTGTFLSFQFYKNIQSLNSYMQLCLQLLFLF